MHYEPVKRRLGKFFGSTPFLRVAFYNLLDLLLLRTWHIHREIRRWERRRRDSVRLYNNVHILDAGAGLGQYAWYLSDFNPRWNILAIDVNKYLVGDCNLFFRKAGRRSVLFKTTDLTRFSAEDCFDLILCIDVLEHIEDDLTVMKNLCRSLRPGALLLLSTPSDQGGSDAYSAGDPSFISEHVRNGYSIADIRDKLTAAGFSRMEARYTYGPPGRISWYISMKYPILMLGWSRLFFVVLPFYYLLFFPVAYVLNHLDVLIPWGRGTGLLVKAWK